MKHNFYKIFPIVYLMTIGFSEASDNKFSDYWYTENKKALVKLDKCPDNHKKWCGKIVSLAEPLDKNGRPKQDKNNTEPTLRSRPVIGINLIWGFIQKGNTLQEGLIYNPEDGNTYSSEVQYLPNDALKVSGCFLTIFCKKQIWTRKPN